MNNLQTYIKNYLEYKKVIEQNTDMFPETCDFFPKPYTYIQLNHFYSPYTNNAGLPALPIRNRTPYMFRRTFATSLLEADVDIRYILEMLGHSFINITEIYTHVAVAKQRDILFAKHPRNHFHL